jgi:hypothetical protein
MKLRRPVIIGCCVVPVLMLMTFYLEASDIMPQDPPLSFGAKASLWFCFVVLWPFWVTSLVLKHEPPELYWMPLWLVTGLFWGFVVEFCIMAKRRLWPNKALQATAAVLLVSAVVGSHNAVVAGVSAPPAAVPELGR